MKTRYLTRRMRNLMAALMSCGLLLSLPAIAWATGSATDGGEAAPAAKAAPAATLIESVELTVAEPEAGQQYAPSSLVSVSPDANYTVERVAFYDEVTGAESTNATSFAKGDTCTLLVTVKAGDAFDIAESVEANVYSFASSITYWIEGDVYNSTNADENGVTDSAMALVIQVGVADANSGDPVDPYDPGDSPASNDYFSVWMCDADHNPNTGGGVCIWYALDNGTYPADSGNVWTSSTNQVVPAGTEVTVEAVPDGGYAFKGWYQANINRANPTDPYYHEDALVSTAYRYTFVGNPIGEGAAPYLCAVFEQSGVQRQGDQVQMWVGNVDGREGGGAVMGGKVAVRYTPSEPNVYGLEARDGTNFVAGDILQFYVGDECTVYAQPDPGYAFVGWYHVNIDWGPGGSYAYEGDVISTDTSFTYKPNVTVVDGDTSPLRYVCAVFAAAQSTVTLPDRTVAYTGQPVAMAGAEVTGSTGAVTYTYYADEACTQELGAADVVQPGTYYVVATVADDGSFPAASSEAAKLTVVADLTQAKMTGLASKTYTGSALTQSPKVSLFGTTLEKGTHYQLAYSSNINAGTATVKAVGLGAYEGTQVTGSFTINKKANPLQASAVKATQTLTYSTAAQTIKQAAAFKVTGAQGKVTYAKKSGNAGITISSAGVITVKAKLAAGSYKCVFTVKAAGNGNHKAGSKDVTVTIKVGKAKPIFSCPAEVVIGKTIAAKVTTDGKVTYKTSNKSVATVSATGVIKGVKAGTAKVTVTVAAGKNYLSGSKTFVVKVGKANTLAAKAKKATVAAKLATLKTKAVVLASNITVSKPVGKVTYANASTNATAMTFKVASSGAVTVPKGTKKGKYQVIITVKAAGNSSTISGTKTVKFYVQVA